ncbi:MAG TPA: cupin domain-containing protein [Bacillota bacterium]
MGANVKIAKLHEQPLIDEHSRFIRALLVGHEIGAKRLEHVDYVTYYAGGSCPVHVHEESEEIFYFLRGTGVAFLDEEEIPFKPGTVLLVPKGVKHGLKCSEDGMVEHIVCCVSVD